MERYVSMWSKFELSKMKRMQALKKIGIKKDNVIIQSPICKVCGQPCIEVDLGTMYLQCLECGCIEEAHYFDNTRFRGRD